jgi:TolB-like protein/Tfp pilus assembly protein PilF
MPDAPSGAPQIPDPAVKDAKDKKKKKNKARAAWISFVGRIVAQIVGAVVTIGLGLYLVNRSNPRSPEPATPSSAAAPQRSQRPDGPVAIAVLPLQNFSGDPKQDYFADGMTEALIAQLAQVKGLRVISRTSSMQYKGQTKPVPQIAQELGVGLIVEGSVARSGDRIRITAQVIDASKDEHIWARSYDRTSSDVLALEADVATAIVGEIQGVAAAQRRAASVQAVDPAVYDLYLRGRHAWNSRTAEGYAEAIRYFEQAIKQDPTFALAHAGLADAYQLGGSALDPDALARARAAAQRALELDADLGEAHASLGGLLHRRENDIEGAEREFRRAIELNAGYATARQWFAILLSEEGRADEALREATEAVALDPLSGLMRQTLSRVHYYGRRYDLAVNEARRALQISPSLPLARETLGRSLVALKRYPEAARVYDPANNLSSDNLATLSLAWRSSGEGSRADVTIGQLLERRPLPVGALVRWYAGSGDVTKALTTLENGVASGFSPQALKNDPAMDALRSHARFQEILRRAGVNRANRTSPGN